MNIVESITSREQGLKKIYGYDVELLRLKCYYDDVYQGVAANVNATDYNPKPPIFACKFSSAPGYEQIIALANEDGKLALHDTAVKRESQDPLDGIQTHDNAVFDIAWMPQEMKLITASGDRTACLWDVANDNIKEVQSFQGHTRSIKCAVFRNQDKAVFATGARDGAIMVWDTRATRNQSGQPKPDNSIVNAHEIKISNTPKQRRTLSQTSKCGNLQSVTALAFQDDYTLISCSAGDGLIKVWDLRKNYTTYKKEPISKYVMNYKGKSNTYNGFTSLLIDPAGISLYASCVDKKIYAYNISSYQPDPVAEYYGHGSNDEILTFFVKACLSPDGEYLASGSNDETAYIWSTRKPGLPFVELSGHRDEVTCIAWCSVGQTKVVTCSDDSYHRIWQVRPEPVNEDDKSLIFGCAERYKRQPTLATNEELSQTPRSSILNSYEADGSGGSKRSYSRIASNSNSNNKSISNLSPILESKQQSSPKRGNIDGRAARKLHFSPSSSSKTEQSSTERTLPIPFSPTTGLPNFVIDGTAPHLHFSPRKSKENVNWLAELRKRKCSSVTDDSPSPKNRKTPCRRVHRLRSNDATKKSPRGSLFVPAITSFYSNLDIDNATTSTS